MSSMKHCLAGEIIAKEGDKAHGFYVLLEGKVGVFRGNNLIAEFSKAGDIIGEVSLILNKPRSAEIKALADSNMLVIAGELDEIIRMYPDISKKLIKTLAERLERTINNKGKL
ncbi:MAG: cyclic nucleotide-binding domain-containing protein [Melioribacteraceae bacterium]